jgi:dolichol-phosphate mannosyltransferase
MPIELSIIIPTFSERDNITPVYESVKRALGEIEWEIIFVDDDSPDGTAARIAELAAIDRRVRLIRRIGRRGLSSACIEGMLASTAPYLAVMDADLQHDESILPAMLAALQQGETDIVIASRYTQGGNSFTWNRARDFISRITSGMGRLVLKIPVSDPMSGFFAIRNDFFSSIISHLSGVGFKILLDILTSSPRTVRVREVPYVFRRRLHGDSKLDTLVAWEFLMLLADKTLGRLIPVRFLGFIINGAIGAILHLGVLYWFYSGVALDFVYAQILAVWAAMTSNFFLNNLLTYRDRRFRGLIGWLTGLAGFYLACGIGALANISIAVFLFDKSIPWYWAGFLGMVVGAVWNYAVTSTLLWQTSRSDGRR